jgi:hypothetical protein
MNPMPTRAELQNRLRQAIAAFHQDDRLLLQFDVNERTVSSRLGVHLMAVFRDWNVDCEYNRDVIDPKQLRPPNEPIEWTDTEAKTVYPDVIVHERGLPNNALVVELKKTQVGGAANFDRDKLRAYTDKQFRYALGAFVTFSIGADGRFSRIEWFERGALSGVEDL